ncbi:MAG: transporter substrate-binding domain-containing protein [Crocinitomicaceae bacterium]
MQSLRLPILWLFVFFFLSQGFSQQGENISENDTLIVGVSGGEPFVFNRYKKGIVVEIWDEIANENNWQYKYVPFKKITDAIDSFENGKIDLLVGPVSITSSRVDKIFFSQPFYNSSIAIVSINKDLTLWQKISPFFSFQLLMAVCVFLIILAIVGAMLWLAERKASPEQFPNSPVAGIGSGMWLAIVTMSTTGYGDKAPITLMGRTIAGVWMIISLISATSMVAGIASTLTLSSLGKTTITHIEQLSDKKAVTIIDSPAEEFLSQSHIKTISVQSIEEAFHKLKNNEVNAIVYDRPQLLHYLKHNNNQDLYISETEYFKQGYGFAFLQNSILVNDVNKSLLELSESGEKERIINFYLKQDK